MTGDVGKTIKWNYVRNVHQKEFHNDITTRRLHMSTGFGGGKTHALAMKGFHLSFINRHIPGGFVAESYADFKKDWLPLIEEILDDRKIRFTYKQNGKYGPHFKFPWTDATIFIQSGEKKIRGPNWGWACINELTLIPLVRYKEVLGRVRIKKTPFPQIASVGTPEGWASDYYEYLIEKPPPNTRVIYGNSRDNIENLDPEYIKDLYDTYDTQMQEAYIEGQWVNMASSRFYYAYDHTKKYNHKAEEWDWYHVAMDFNVDPMAASVWQFDGHKLKGITEICLEGGIKGADTRQMGRALYALGYKPNNTIIYPDPSGNARSTKGKPDIHILREEFHYTEIRVKKKAPGFRQRQLNMNNRFEQGVIQPNHETQPKTCKDFMSVEQVPVTYEKDKSNPKLTHFSDGVDYMVDILMPFKRPQRQAFQGTRT